MEPAAGFYARVMQRIEEKAQDSIWAVFVYSPFGKRLAFGSLSRGSAAWFLCSGRGKDRRPLDGAIQ